MASVVCTPSRYVLLTGQYASRSATLHQKHPPSTPANVEFNTDILPGQWHLARGMKAAGYTTGIVGKWHNTDNRGKPYVVSPPICDYMGRENGPQDPLLPENERRVRAAYAAAVKHLHDDIGWDFVSSIYMNNANALGLPKPLWEHENNMEWFTAGALKFLEQNKDRPFFLYFAPNVPHGGGGDRFAKTDPRGTPEGWVDWHLGVQPARDDVIRRVKNAGLGTGLAWATWLDDGIGVILKKLDELKLTDNTIVIFSSDQQSLGKWSCYEGGARVPFTIRWPGYVAPGTVDATLLSSVDLVPTLLELAGGRPPPVSEAILDGRSFVPLLAGGTLAERTVLIEMGYGRAIIHDGWKYIAIRYPDEVLARVRAKNILPDYLGRPSEEFDRSRRVWTSYTAADQLYDLRADPMEQRNLADHPEHAPQCARMRRLLQQALAPLPNVFGEFKTAIERS
jgi:arylsulfatase A-like enzyme